MDFQVGLIGFPIVNSLSPAMHNAAFQSLGLNMEYHLWNTEQSDLSQRIAMLKNPEFLGANVTVPYKQTVLPLMDVLAPSAQQAGAVNTIVHRNGLLVGENTDVSGLLQALQELRRQISRAVVIGSGGAAYAACAALAELNTGHTAIFARNVPAADRMMRHFIAAQPEYWNADSISHVLPGSPGAAEQLAAADCVIQASSFGAAHNSGCPLTAEEIALLPDTALVYDVILYETPLVQAARQRNLEAANGASMLLYQGALAWTMWTRCSAPIEIMRTALQTALGVAQ